MAKLRHSDGYFDVPGPRLSGGGQYYLKMGHGDSFRNPLLLRCEALAYIHKGLEMGSGTLLQQRALTSTFAHILVTGVYYYTNEKETTHKCMKNKKSNLGGDSWILADTGAIRIGGGSHLSHL
jgi:hypothetical protein